MEQVATAAGISRKSLFTYFPSKSDLIWDRLAPYVEDLRNDLSRQDGPEGLDAAVHAIVEGISRWPEQRDVFRLHTRLVLTEPALVDLVEVRSRPWRSQLADYLSTSLGAGSALPEAMAYGCWRATLRGLQRWLDTDDDAPTSHVSAELRSLLVAAARLEACDYVQA
ncbi:transcriptional regulator, TetR family [Pseudonocardia oroxyli]|uniref:Transcriptional regulator, TetR family n=2 Tax=Pseudonocardia oroxyli TaxID=366584 RepID=A0A1G8EII1_PSEOR|nr:transcriptional regulator, TetR family [Pseudonocardia oroxyli]